jgi:hypothetical protein
MAYAATRSPRSPLAINSAPDASPASTSQSSTPDDDGTRIDQIVRTECGALLEPIGRKRKKRQVLEPEVHRIDPGTLTGRVFGVFGVFGVKHERTTDLSRSAAAAYS